MGMHLFIFLTLFNDCYLVFVEKNIYKVSRTEGFRFGRPSSLYPSTGGRIDHIEVYEDGKQLLILVEGQLKLVNQHSVRNFSNKFAQTEEIKRALRFSPKTDLEMYIETFLQIASTKLILVYRDVYCLVLFQLHSNPSFSRFAGGCEQSGPDIDLRSIVAVVGNHKNPTILYVLFKNNGINTVNVLTRRIAPVVGARNIFGGWSAGMSYGMQSLVMTVADRIYEFALSSKILSLVRGDRRIYGSLEKENNPKVMASDGLLLDYYKRLYMCIVTDSGTSTLRLVDRRQGLEYSYYCSHFNQHLPLQENGNCFLERPSLLVQTENKLYIVDKGSQIYTMEVIPVKYCGSDYGWVSDDEYPRVLEYSGASPLAPGIYTYQENKKRTHCLTKIILSKSTNISEPGVCERVRIISLNKTANSVDVVIFDGIYLALSQGTTYFTNRTSGLCRARFTLRKSKQAETTTNTAVSTTSSTRNKGNASPRRFVVDIIFLMAAIAVVCISIFILLIFKRHKRLSNRPKPIRKQLTRQSPVTISSPHQTVLVHSLDSAQSNDKLSLPSTKSVQNQGPSGTSLRKHRLSEAEFIKEESILYKKVKLKPRA